MIKYFTFACLIFLNIHTSIAQVSSNMNLLDQWDQAGLNYNDVWGYVDGNNNEYAIVGSYGKIHFFEITPSNTLSLVDEFTPGSNTVWRDFKTYGNYAYAVSEGNEGLLVYDLSNLPTSVTLSSQSSAQFSRAHNIYIDEANGRLYVAGSNTQSNGLIIYDITTSTPTHLASVSLTGGGYVHDLYVKNNIAYCSHGWNGYFIWDMTTANNPTFLASYTGENGYNHSSWVTDDGNTAFYAREVGVGLPMTVLDISNYNNISVTSNFKFPLLAPAHTNNVPHNPYLVGNLLYTSYYEDGVQVFDVSDPANVTQAAYYDTYPINNQYNGYEGCWGVYPFLPSGKILASDGDNGLFLLELDFSNNNPPLVINITNQSDVSCFGGNDGFITVSSSGGAGPYTYNIDNGPFQSSGIFTNVSAGNHTIGVNDNAGVFTTLSVTINEPDQITPFITQQQNVSCFGNADGLILANAVGGTIASNYLYSIDGTNFSTNDFYSNLSAGSYILTVRDDNNCEESIPFTINEPPLLEIFVLSQSDINCFGENSGAVTLISTGGNSGYTYSLDQNNYQSNNTFTNLSAENYTVYSLDNSNCQAQASFSISEPSQLQLSITQQTNLNCFEENNGEIVLSGQGGNGGYEFNLNGGTYQSGSTFSNLSAGNYDISIKDANDCITTMSTTITSPPEILVELTQVTDVDCFGGNTGSVSVNATGGAGGFSISLNGNIQTGNATTFANLTAGSYSLVVDDANNCSTTQDVIITENSEVQLFVSNSQNISCNGANDGSIEVLTLGGNGNYSYTLNNTAFGNNNVFTNLSAGQYDIIVADDLNCQDVISVTLSESASFQLNISSQNDESCTGANDGSISINGTGGNGNFQYTLNNNTNATGIFNNLSAGNYNVIAVDGNNCVQSLNFNINAAAQISANISNQTAVDCFGGNNGSVQIQASGGNGNLNFSLGNQNNSTGLFENLTAGNYNITITDDNNCQTTVNANITEPSSISSSILNLQNIDCFGESNGTIQIQANGGTGNLNFSLGNQNNSTGLFENLTAGNYNIIITDDNNCQTTVNANITEPTSISSSILNLQNIDCFGGSNGSIQLQANGGTGNLNFSLGNQNNSTGLFENLTTGNYNITITDDNNCQTTGTYNITEPTLLTLDTTSVQLASCSGQEGSIQVNAQGGTPPYQFSNGNTSNSDGFFGNLSAGIYIVTVTDGNNCSTTIDIDIMEPNALNVEIISTQHPNCFGENTGGIQLNTIGGTGNINYTLGSDINSTGSFQNLSAGNYNIIVTDANNCNSFIDIAIIEPALLEISTNQITNVNCFGDNSGSVNLSAIGGINGFTFSLNNQTNTSGVFENLPVGNYTAMVTDANGCEDMLPIEITQPTMLTTNIVQINPVGCPGETNGMVQFEANGGTGNYQFSMAGLTNSTGLFENLAADDYMMNITDNNNCSTSLNVTITEPLSIAIDLLDTQDVLCNGDSTGVINLAASGGAGNIMFSLENETNTTGTFDNLFAGNYNITITDANNCTNTIQSTINEPSNIAINIDQIQSTLCQGENSGSINLSASGGTGTFVYVLGNDSNELGEFTNLSAGIYEVMVLDIYNCTSSITFEITEPDSLILSASQIQPTNCNGDNTGSVQLSASGGNGNYQFTSQNGDSNTTGLFENLPAGDFTITMVDDNNCSQSIVINIPQPTPILINIPQTQNIDCHGNNSGSLQLSAMGGTDNFIYTLGNETNTTGTFENLFSGIYNIIITDGNNCTTTVDVELTEPAAITATMNQTQNILCAGDTSGVVQINATGGTGNLEFTLGNETNPTGIFENLNEGTYSVNISDINNCTTTFDFTITAPQVFVSNISQTQNILCAGDNNGTIEATATGGTGTPTYTLNGISNTTGVFENLSSGIYNIIITDENNCNANQTIEITQPDSLALVVDNISSADCAGAATGNFQVLANGGTGTYTYTTNNQTNTTGFFENLSAGVYTCEVVDENNCTFSLPITINENNNITLIEIDIINPSCFGDNSGTVLLNTSGGVGTLTYNLDGATNTTGSFGNLSAGTYNIIVTDSVNCSSIFSAVLFEPDTIAIILDALTATECLGDSTGTAQLFASGGVGNYTFEINNNSNSTGFFDNLPGGENQVTVIDSNNCVNTYTFLIPEPTAISATITDLLHDMGNGGSATLSGIGGTPGYTYSIDGVNFQTNNVFENLLAGNYIGYVQDLNGCLIEIPFEIFLETAVTNFDLGILAMDVFPNPFSEKITLSINSNTAQDISIQMINISGKVISNQNNSIQAGQQNIILNVESEIPAGIYFLSVKNKKQHIGYFKIIKQ